MRILIKLEVPAASAAYEMMVPNTLTIKELETLVIKGVENLSNNRYVPSGVEFLCAEAFDLPLDERLTLGDYGIENGDRLFLI